MPAMLKVLVCSAYSPLVGPAQIRTVVPLDDVVLSSEAKRKHFYTMVQRGGESRVSAAVEESYLESKSKMR